jgi:hypothetical protein
VHQQNFEGQIIQTHFTTEKACGSDFQGSESITSYTELLMFFFAHFYLVNIFTIQ